MVTNTSATQVPDIVERLRESEVCDGCHGSGQSPTGYTYGESDGNAPELETCGTCGGPGFYVSDLHREAADEILRLRAEVERVQRLHTGIMQDADARYMSLYEENRKLTAAIERKQRVIAELVHVLEVFVMLRNGGMPFSTTWKGQLISVDPEKTLAAARKECEGQG